MITVHHLNNSRSQRVLWLLEELGVGYEVKHYQRDPETMLAPPELLAVHPLGKSPVITDGTHTIAESGAIIEYLVDRYGDGRLKPALGSPERLRYTYWLHFRRGLGHAAIAVAADIQPDRGRSHAFFVKPVARAITARVNEAFIAPNLARQLKFMESELAAREWFVGDEFSAADIQMSFPLEVARQRALSAGGAYDLAS
jgi:glutathione S-transferase